MKQVQCSLRCELAEALYGQPWTSAIGTVPIQYPLSVFLGQERKVSTRQDKVDSSAALAVIPKGPVRTQPQPKHSMRSEDTDPFFMVRRRR